MKKEDNFQTIDEYINTFSGEIQTSLKLIRQTIRNVAPDATETINYQMPTFKLNNKNLVHFAAYKKHIGFYPTPSAIERFNDELLSSYRWSKGAIQFPLNKPIPYDLIKRIVSFRVKELSSQG